MIRIVITRAAFDASAKTLPLGSVAFEGQLTEKGERVTYLDDRVADRLGVKRQRGEGYSEAIRLTDLARKSANRPQQLALVDTVAS
jgi:hypothetical protein